MPTATILQLPQNRCATPTKLAPIMQESLLWDNSSSTSTILPRVWVTGVDTISANKQVENVIYYSPTGVAHATPFDGINIMVTTYTDGSTSATKFVK